MTTSCDDIMSLLLNGRTPRHGDQHHGGHDQHGCGQASAAGQPQRAPAILRVILRLDASCFETDVSAARQPDSDPICEKPMVSWAALAGSETNGAAAAVAAKRAGLAFMRRSPGMLSRGRQF